MPSTDGIGEAQDHPPLDDASATQDKKDNAAQQDAALGMCNSADNPLTETPATASPSVDRVLEYLLYGLSLPERTLRSTSALLGGMVRESAELLVPQAFRSSNTYRAFVEQSLDFVLEKVGGVAAEKEPEQAAVEGFVARKAVGGFIELAALPLLHVSPMTVLAVISDVAYGSQAYLAELSRELKQQGVIDQETTIDHTADLLEAISGVTSKTASAIDMPPLSVDGLRETIRQITEAASSVDPTRLLPQAEVERIWDEMHQIATQEQVSAMQVSSTITMFAMHKVGTLGRGALSTITVAGNMFDKHILDHYAQGIREIHTKGLYATLAESGKPYIDALWWNFSSDRETLTSDLLTGRLVGRTWSAVRGWFRKTDETQ